MGQISGTDKLVSSRFLLQTYLACQDLGARKPVLLDAISMTDAAMRDPRNQYDPAIVRALYSAASKELDGENIFVAIARAMIPDGFSDLGHIMRFKATIPDVISGLAKELSFGGGQDMFHFEQAGSDCRLIWQAPINDSAEFACIAMMTIVQQLHRLSKRGFPMVKSLSFTCPEPAGFQHMQPFGEIYPSCHFNRPETGIEFQPYVYAMTNSHYNVAINQFAARARISGPASTPKPAYTSLIYAYLAPLLDKAGLNLASAAITLRMAERTLRRRLLDESTCFRDILENVRRDFCQLYFLEGTRSLSDIALKLGYSELSAFTRAYTKWYGRPPSHDLATLATQQIALAA